MALKKNVKDQSEKSLRRPMISDELLFRIVQIAGQTNLSPPDLVLKWVLQEESLIGSIQSGIWQAIKQPKTAMDIPVQKEKGAKDVSLSHKNQEYKKELVKKAEMLKKKGMTHKKIAEAFNDEKVPTVSGTGKWYASSINILLNSKK